MPTPVVKWIRAHSSRPAAFDAAQGRWSAIAGVAGFGGQHGGWSTQDPRHAIIVAAWASRPAHEAFLDGGHGHDDLAESQRATYSRIDIDLLDVEIATEPTATLPPGARVLRTAACRLRPGRLHHVLDVQRRVWLPAMTEAGMVWGLLARREDTLRGEDLVVVLTAWPSMDAHDDYQRRRVPELRRRAGTAEDVTSIDSDVIVLEPSWSLAPD